VIIICLLKYCPKLAQGHSSIYAFLAEAHENKMADINRECSRAQQVCPPLKANIFILPTFPRYIFINILPQKTRLQKLNSFQAYPEAAILIETKAPCQTYSGE